MPKTSFVFKVERPQVAFTAELSNGQSADLLYLAPNARQLKSLQEKGAENIEVTEKLLRESVVGDASNAFVDDLLENGSVASFLNTMSEQLQNTRKAKTKN